MSKAHMVSAYLRRQAWWRLNRVENEDGGDHARSALALLDAASHAARVGDGDPVIVALDRLGCFGLDGFSPGDEADRVVRNWHFEPGGGGGLAEPDGEPWELLTALPKFVEVSRARFRASI